MIRDASTRLLQHLTTFCAEIGPRPIGSAQNHAAADYIQHVFAGVGLATSRQAFACPQWSATAVQLTCGNAALPATVNTFSPACDVHGPLLPFSTIAELAQADLTDCIALLRGDLAQGPIAPLNSPIYLPEEHQLIGQLLRDKQPRAVIMVANKLRANDKADPLPLLEDWTLTVPSVTVSSTVGLDLLTHADRGVALRIASTQQAGASCNVLGRTTGSAPERVVICAHFDTKFGTPGAFDNGSGIAVLLTLAEMIHGVQSPCDFEFIAFNGEEYNGLGDEAYLQEVGLSPVRFGEAQMPRSPELAHIHAAINIDGVGHARATNTVAIMNSSDALQQTVSDALHAFPTVARTDPWPASNHYTFYSHGVPCVVLGSDGGADVMHRATDTLDGMSAAKLNEVVEFVMTIVQVC